jgi:hypothetical protein
MSNVTAGNPTLHCLSLRVCLLHPSTGSFTAQDIEGWFTQATEIIAFVWPRNPRYRQYFDFTKPLLQLTASTLNGAQFMGQIAPKSTQYPLELDCDFRQISNANDGSLYISTVYPACKITQEISDDDAIGIPRKGRGTGSQRKKWQQQGGRIDFRKM